MFIYNSYNCVSFNQDCRGAIYHDNTRNHSISDANVALTDHYTHHLRTRWSPRVNSLLHQMLLCHTSSHRHSTGLAPSLFLPQTCVKVIFRCINSIREITLPCYCFPHSLYNSSTDLGGNVSSKWKRTTSAFHHILSFGWQGHVLTPLPW